jgi:hypothetical protein
MRGFSMPLIDTTGAAFWWVGRSKEQLAEETTLLITACDVPDGL